MPPPKTRKPPETRGIDTTSGAFPRSPRPATADTRSKGSDHDHDPYESEDGHRTADGRPDTPDGDHADGPHDADQPDADSPRDGGQGTTDGGAERAVDGSARSTAGHRPDVGRVMLKTTPEGAAWVLVEGADFAELAERINVVYDALTRPQAR
ncbi:hypothetical protein SAMN04489729_3447 [Amycolatopsis lurida]|uniref:Uncharacterized protein n=1 Tax=Amycolatopsis lurida NRRL 2430 TaxID=1460371 RepID=A0A2P2FLT4_AMYLU|nr:hypothetical protein BB31_29975 [Amycolatopsis lurida NRRL 2430]SED12938.1 hypothetical protein SAMN04489729_3447 [Amycolatopsis lurida]